MLARRAGSAVPEKTIKNRAYTVKITGIGSEGQGVGHLGSGCAVFVPGALPGEIVSALIITVKTNYCVGKLIDIIEPSPNRVNPPCPVYGKCGGCGLLHCSYPYQLEIKRQLLGQAFKHIGRFSSLPLPPVTGMSNPFRYRNKSSFPVSVSDRSPAIGFYSKRSHRIIPISDCLVDHEVNPKVIQSVSEYMRRFNISAYNENTGGGLLRHVLLRVGFSTDEVMVCLVINGGSVPGIPALAESLKADIPGFATLALNINKKRTNVIMGGSSRAVYGPGFIHDNIGDLRFEISPSSFYQINPVQTKVLYDTALEFAGLTGKETVVEAYSGIGAISLYLARFAGHVYAAEIAAEAVKDAGRNAEINGIANVTFFNDNAETWLPEFCGRYSIKPDVCVVDPPRKGCGAGLLQAIAALPARKLIYVSCDMGTLARDTRLLNDMGYTLTKLQPVDMFPQTPHVEAVALLEWQAGNSG